MLLKSPRKCVCFELGAVSDNFMIRYLDKSYLEGRPTTGRLKLQLVKKEQLLNIRQDRWAFGHFCGLENVHVLSVFTHDYRVVFIFVLNHHGHRVTLSDEVRITWTSKE